ncbi:MAG: RDD family protein [Verrucomicrobiae bacterium]|nr:RDD family protein [Verrucomicrobiae bacterium]
MSLGKTATLEIWTPEGVSFSLALASPVSRCLAWLLDIVIIAVITIGISIGLNLLAVAVIAIPVLNQILIDFAQAIQVFLSFVVSIFYAIALEWLWRGRTVGKRVLGLQVVDERGLNLTLRQILIRNFFRIVDILPSMFYLVGATSCVLSKRCQRLGDIAAGTLVIRHVTLPEPELDQVLAKTGYNSFAEHPHLEARLRQRSTPEEAQIALDSLLRRDELESASRLKVFSRIADHFRSYAEFPEEATLGLSDEQYVRNVVDTLYRKSVVI